MQNQKRKAAPFGGRFCEVQHTATEKTKGLYQNNFSKVPPFRGAERTTVLPTIDTVATGSSI